MLKVDSYSAKGTKLAAVSLPKEWERENLPLLAQAMRVYEDRSHFGLRKTKTRGDVNRTTKKVYKQKGTGGARHGARSAPIYVGGGIAFGPRGLKRTLTLPQALKRKALEVSLTQAVKEKRVIVSDLNFKKTKEAQAFINKILGKDEVRIIFVIKKENIGLARYLRNIKNVRVVSYLNLNAYDVFYGGNIIFDKTIFATEVKEKKTRKAAK
ncbi:MAG TPA: 50S ribosomal protein L4 [Candidatus Saccharimonadales bacterium]|nr:50S ribosomal protein L4 [Candidatus Saccharimonadales bacterium]